MPARGSALIITGSSDDICQAARPPAARPLAGHGVALPARNEPATYVAAGRVGAGLQPGNGLVGWVATEGL
jgi:hypothetical protein